MCEQSYAWLGKYSFVELLNYKKTFWPIRLLIHRKFCSLVYVVVHLIDCLLNTRPQTNYLSFAKHVGFCIT